MPRPPIEPDERPLQRLREAAKTVEVAKRHLAKAEMTRDRLILDCVGHANQEAIADAADVSTAAIRRKSREAKKGRS